MTPKPIFALGLSISLGTLFTACDLSPKYTRPMAPVPKNLPENAASAGALAPAELHWQDYFTDPGLQSVIRLALDNSRDLRISSLNVEKAQALYRIQRSNLTPTMGIRGSGNKYRLPEKMNGGTAKDVEQDSVNVGVLSWELDFFGRLRSLRKQAMNQYLATEQAKAAAQISLIATVAQGYFTYAADQENLELAQRTFDAQKSYYDLIHQSNELGVASELDLRQAQSQMESARADMARFRGLVATDLNALELVVGTSVPAGQLPKGLSAITPLKDVSAGLSSDVLLRRPDILRTEYQLKAANANIGAARAAFFPNVSLTAGIGTMSPEFSSLFKSGTSTWSFSPQINLPLFAGGSLWANLGVAKADRDIAVAQYESAVQAAFREVADGLVRRSSYVEQLDAQHALVESLETTYRLSDLRYKEGLDGYLGVLVAQRSLYSAQQGWVATRLANQINQVTLYKALGGRL